jgi:hypothetical protein
MAERFYIESFLMRQANSISWNMKCFIIQQGIDFFDLFGAKWSENHARGRSWASSVDDDATSLHSCSGVRSNVAVNNHKSVLHAPTNPLTGCTSDHKNASFHAGTCVVTTSIKHGNDSTSHFVAGKVSSHALTNDGCAIVCCSQK